jgi:fermentation-respiration switch protein FrsA (DUF1100 family)
MKNRTRERETNGEQRHAMRFVWRFVRGLLVVYLLLLLAMLFLENWLVYPIPPVSRGDWQPAGLEFENVYFTSADGTKLHGWLVERPNAKRAILYCHGNGEDVSMNAYVVAQLSESLDATVFVFDYRGYGHSEGSPSEAGCVEDALAAQRWLAERTGRSLDEIVVMGRSIGGAIATAVASRQGAKALVLISTFSRLTDVASLHYRWLPVRTLMKNRYDAVDQIRQYDGPVFQSHGTADWIVPIELGRRLFAAAPTQQKQFAELADRGHNDPEPASYYRELGDFLNRLE